MTAYTPETIAALSIADRRYTRTFMKAMTAFDRENDLRTAMQVYNTLMGPASRRWKADMKAAVELADEPF